MDIHVGRQQMIGDGRWVQFGDTRIEFIDRLEVEDSQVSRYHHYLLEAKIILALLLTLAGLLFFGDLPS